METQALCVSPVTHSRNSGPDPVSAAAGWKDSGRIRWPKFVTLELHVLESLLDHINASFDLNVYGTFNSSMSSTA